MREPRAGNLIKELLAPEIFSARKGRFLDHNVLIHRGEDHTGVAVVDIRAGEKVRGIVVADGSRIELEALQDVPLAHKIAVKAVAPGEAILVQGHPAGAATRPIEAGEHVHVHNMRSLRWP